MEPSLFRLLIQEKLADGRLPMAPIPRVGGGRGTGQTCDGCGETVNHAQMVVENLDQTDRAVRFHAGCFHVWNVERQGDGHEPGARLPARSAFRPLGVRPIRSWAPSPPSARPATP
jgi:hypothetical protein